MFGNEQKILHSIYVDGKYCFPSEELNKISSSFGRSRKIRGCLHLLHLSPFTTNLALVVKHVCTIECDVNINIL
jgi:hypothetical protein